MAEMKLNFSQFTPVVERFLRKTTPAAAVESINEIAKDVRKEMVKATPRRVGYVGPQRRGRRIQKKGFYGPLRTAWRRKSSKRLDQPAEVRNIAFYARLVVRGTAHSRGQNFFDPVVNRIPKIAGPAIARVAARRKAKRL